MVNVIAFRLIVQKTHIAPNMAAEEDDRFSVAFGLSFFDVQHVIQAIPEPPLTQDSRDKIIFQRT